MPIRLWKVSVFLSLGRRLEPDPQFETSETSKSLVFSGTFWLKIGPAIFRTSVSCRTPFGLENLIMVELRERGLKPYRATTICEGKQGPHSVHGSWGNSILWSGIEYLPCSINFWQDLTAGVIMGPENASNALDALRRQGLHLLPTEIVIQNVLDVSGNGFD